MTALMHAIVENQLASVELLCNKGADVHHRDKVFLIYATISISTFSFNAVL